MNLTRGKNSLNIKKKTFTIIKNCSYVIVLLCIHYYINFFYFSSI